ncbi:hypothetical protein SSCG_00849 [Streptomyces clavuligerus]|nr:hypothetical protein SSCG_00849 [Streptomyces clavuligerus]
MATAARPVVLSVTAFPAPAPNRMSGPPPAPAPKRMSGPLAVG